MFYLKEFHLLFLKEFFENVNFEKNQQTTKKHAKFSRMQQEKQHYEENRRNYASTRNVGTNHIGDQQRLS